MTTVKICVGSSCHLKGSEKLVELFQKALEENSLQGQIDLAGSFCTGKCNRTGVTVTLNNKIYTGITPDNFNSFFNSKVLPLVKKR